MPEFPIAYPTAKPNAGLAAALLGHHLIQRDGAWVCRADDQAGADTCQSFLDAFDDLATARTNAKARLREALDRRSTVDRAQNEVIGLLAQALRIAIQRSGTAFASWPTADRNTVTAINNRIRRFEDLAAAADLIGADIDALTDSGAIDSFDPEASGRWPAGT